MIDSIDEIFLVYLFREIEFRFCKIVNVKKNGIPIDRKGWK